MGGVEIKMEDVNLTRNENNKTRLSREFLSCSDYS